MFAPDAYSTSTRAVVRVPYRSIHNAHTLASNYFLPSPLAHTCQPTSHSPCPPSRSQRSTPVRIRVLVSSPPGKEVATTSDLRAFFSPPLWPIGPLVAVFYNFSQFSQCVRVSAPPLEHITALFTFLWKRDLDFFACLAIT